APLDTNRDVSGAQPQAFVGADLLGTVPLVNPNQSTRRRAENATIGKLDFLAIRFGPPADRKWVGRAPVEGTIYSPAGRYLEPRQNQMRPPKIVQGSARDDIPVTPQPGPASVLVGNGFQFRDVLRTQISVLLVGTENADLSLNYVLAPLGTRVENVDSPAHDLTW